MIDVGSGEMPDLSSGNCNGLDPDLFFDDYLGVESESIQRVGQYEYTRYISTAPRQHAMLRRVCLSCPVVNQCREWSITHELYGFWGGMTAMERESERTLKGIKLVDPALDNLAVRSATGTTYYYDGSMNE